MRTQIRTILVTTSLLGAVTLATAESVQFEVIASGTVVGKSSEANDLTPDGRWIVGTWDTNADGFPDDNYRLDTLTDTLMLLGGSGRAVAISDDGQTIVGNMIDPGGSGSNVAAIWTQAGGWQSLGALPTAAPCGLSTGYEISGNALVAVGLSWDGCNGQGFKWTQADAMEGLEILANGTNRASVVSADGSVIGGFAQGSFSRTPAIWDAATLEGQLLDPPNGDVIGEVHGMSDDGEIMLAEWDGDAVTWTEAGGPNVIDQGQLLPTWIGLPFDIADDGTVVGFDFLGGARQAWIAVPAGSEELIIALSTFVTSQGGTIPAGFETQVCQAISADARTVIGHTGFPTPGAWIMQRCPEDVDGNGSVDVTDLLEVLGLWGPCPDCTTPFACPADINGDCEFDVTDLLAVLGRWGPC